MLSGNLDNSDLQIKQDDKFFSRLLSKEETPVCNSSFRVYYGGASGAVPFLWESRPGTPKKRFCDTSLPPLTPPPSYQVSSKRDSIKKPSKFKLIHTLFPRLSSVKKSHVSPTSSMSSSSSWSSSLSSLPSTPTTSKVHRRLPSSLSSFDYRGDDHDEEASLGSPTSTLCFGLGRGSSGNGGFKGC